MSDVAPLQTESIAANIFRRICATHRVSRKQLDTVPLSLLGEWARQTTGKTVDVDKLKEQLDAYLKSR